MGEILYNILSQIVSAIFFIGLVLFLIISALYYIYMGFFYDAEKVAEKEFNEQLDKTIQDMIDHSDERYARFVATVTEMEAQKAKEAKEKEAKAKEDCAGDT